MKFSERRIREKIKKNNKKISEEGLSSDLQRAEADKVLQLLSASKYIEAERYAQNLIQIFPQFYLGWKLLADVLSAQGKETEVLLLKKTIVRNFNTRPEAYYNLGNSQYKNRNYEDAILSFNQAIALKSDFVEAYLNKGHSLSELWRIDEALAAYEAAIEIRPGFAEAYNGIALCFVNLNRISESIHVFDKAISLKRDYAEAYCNRGSALKKLEKFTEALADNLYAISLKPSLKKAYYNVGLIYFDQKDYIKSEEYISAALKIDGEARGIEASFVFLKQQTCAWAGMFDEINSLLSSVDSGQAYIGAFDILSISDSLKINLQVATREANRSSQGRSCHQFNKKKFREKKLKIGYFSSDFREHAVGHLIVDLLESHDKSRFEIHAFSLSNKNEGEIRRRILKGVDYFYDVCDLSDNDIVKLAREKSIDIAVDVNGYTQYAKTGVFAYGAAPLQINYLGFPGTMGAEFIDYIVADHTLIPEASRKYYKEKIIYMPGSYQPNDRKRAISDIRPSKKDLNINEEAFVFGCFNNSFKILPDIFRVWMKILESVPNSVLLLLDTSEYAKTNISEEVERCGINRNRIIFCPFLPHAEHLARYCIIDLFLDTLPYNAHTTASDALWSGVPVLTCVGETFASRVGASLLHAVGMSELITTNMDDYKNRAIGIASSPGEIRRLKCKLENNLPDCALFNTEAYVRNIEEAYIKISDLYHMDMPTEHIFL